MRRILVPLLLAGFAAVALALAPPSAMADNLPPGEWQKHCRDARVDGNKLFAECRSGKDDKWELSTINLKVCGSRALKYQKGRLVCD